MVKPLIKRRIVKKKTTPFRRFQSDLFKRVGESWRKPRGIDNRVRRKYKGAKLAPKIGYGSNKKTRHLLQNGFYKFLVRDPRDINLLLMHNRKYAAEIAHNISARKRKIILTRAAQLDVKVTNRHGRVRSAEASSNKKKATTEQQ